MGPAYNQVPIEHPSILYHWLLGVIAGQIPTKCTDSVVVSRSHHALDATSCAFPYDTLSQASRKPTTLSMTVKRSTSPKHLSMYNLARDRNPALVSVTRHPSDSAVTHLELTVDKHKNDGEYNAPEQVLCHTCKVEEENAC